MQHQLKIQYAVDAQAAISAVVCSISMLQVAMLLPCEHCGAFSHQWFLLLRTAVSRSNSC